MGRLTRFYSVYFLLDSASGDYMIYENNLMKIIKIIAILVLILGMSVPALFLFVPEMASHTGLHFGNLEFTFVESVHLQIPRTFSFALFFAGALSAAAGIRVISLLQKIFQPMAEGQPFHDQIAPSIRKIAWLHMIFAFLNQIISSVVSVLTFHALNMETLLRSPSVAAVGLDLEFNCNFLLTFGLLLLLSYVFEYGQELQKLSDETV